MIAYGYRPHYAIYWSIFVVIVGTILFCIGYQNKLITPTEKDCKPPSSQSINNCSNNLNYPKFNPIVYSLDVFLPVINLRIEDSWLPNANKGNEDKVLHYKAGEWLRFYFWFHIVLGWALTSLWVAGFTGLVRKTNK